MRQRNGQNRNMLLLSGWLFADLFLVLVVVFLATNVFDIRSLPSQVVKPTPTPTLPRLELHKDRFYIQVDPNGLRNNSPGTINSVKQQVADQAFLRGRSVGLAIVYGGALNDGQIGTALDIATRVYAILTDMGKSQAHSTFSRASFYDPLYVFGANLSTVAIDIYLFAS